MPSAARIAVHATHEAAQKLGGIGAVLAGILPEPAYRRAFERTLLVGPHLFGTGGCLVEVAAQRKAGGLAVFFDSASDDTGPLAEVAQRFGVRLVHAERQVAGETRAEVLLASPEGAVMAQVDAYRHQVRERYGVDLASCDAWPAVSDRVDRRLERLLDPEHGRPDIPDEILLDDDGHPLPGGADTSAGHARFPPILGLDVFSGFAASNRYLLELQVHSFVAPALWAAVTALLGADALPAVTLFCHDWLGVPLFWAAGCAGQPPGQSVYFAHEARLFRLLAEGALSDWSGILNRVCHVEGHDAALYPYLRRAAAEGWDAERMYPGSGGFQTIPYHRLTREAAWFDRVVAVGRLVREEMRVALRPPDRPDIALCPNGIPAAPVTAEAAWDSRQRLLTALEPAAGYRPDILLTGVMRCELSKAPWRNVGLVRALAERWPALKVACLWLSAPRPRPSEAQVRRWASEYRWPCDHRPGPVGDLRPEEEALWRAIEALNFDFGGRCTMLYINQFGWGKGLLGALDPVDSTFDDVRCGTDAELGLSVYEPFGIAPLEPFFAGAVCLLSDCCGCALELQALGAGDRVVIGRFTEHHLPPEQVDGALRRAIEGRVYAAMADALVARLGLADGPLDESAWRSLRAARLAAAEPYRDRLSWTAAVEQGLLPALGLGHGTDGGRGASGE